MSIRPITDTVSHIGGGQVPPKAPPARNPTHPTTDALNADWQRDESETRRATYYRGGRHAQRGGYVGQYEGTNSYNWQDIRYEHRLSGIAEGADAAMAACDASMALADEEFNARVAASIITELKRLEKNLLELQPNTTLLTGYHTGFEAGFAKARESVFAALERE